MAEATANDFSTSVGTGGIASGVGATGLPVNDVAPTALRSGPFAIVVNAGTPTQEVMEVTAGASGTTWTVTRASEPIGTTGVQTAFQHFAGEPVQHVATAGGLDNRYYQADSGWVNATYKNGWSTSAGQQPAAYRKIGNLVSCRGMVFGGTIPSAAFAFPSGYYPTGGDAHFNAVCSTGGFFCYIDHTNGNLMIETAGATWYALRNVIFMIGA